MFAKVFVQIFDSSIADNWKTRHVFEDLLKLADINGVVDMTHESIAARTRMPLEMIREAITELEAPDPRSRSVVADGRRIERLDENRDWGWYIVNYQKYRDISSEDQRREMTRKRVAAFKLKRRDLQEGNAEVTQGNAEVTQGNAEVTQGNAEVTLGNASFHMEREMEKKKKNTHTEKGVSVLPRIIEKINAMFLRKPSTRWTYAEESSLAEICRREDVEAEIAEIISWKARIPETDKKFFPQSVFSLLSNWGSAVDRARQPKCMTQKEVEEMKFLRSQL